MSILQMSELQLWQVKLTCLRSYTQHMAGQGCELASSLDSAHSPVTSVEQTLLFFSFADESCDLGWGCDLGSEEVRAANPIPVLLHHYKPPRSLMPVFPTRLFINDHPH